MGFVNDILEKLCVCIFCVRQVCMMGNNPNPEPIPKTTPPVYGIQVPGCPSHVSASARFTNPMTGSCYYYYIVSDTLHQAVSRCEAEGTRVVALETPEEQNWLFREICIVDTCSPAYEPPVWLGMFRKPSSQWTWFYKNMVWPVHQYRWSESSLMWSAGYTAAMTYPGDRWESTLPSNNAGTVCESAQPGGLAPPQPQTPPPPPPPTASVPASCPKVGAKGDLDNEVITQYVRLSLSTGVEELAVFRKGSRLTCAKRCSSRRRCALFQYFRDGPVCVLLRQSEAGPLVDCTGSQSACYWKLCWLPSAQPEDNDRGIPAG